MPVFERNYFGQGFNPQGKPSNLPPRHVLQTVGPSLNIVLSVTEEHQRALSSKGRSIPQPVSGAALIDTGASLTAVDEEVCRQLGLQPTGIVNISHANGSTPRNTYPIQIIFPGTPLPSLLLASALSVDLSCGTPRHIALLGRDLLSNLRMVYNGPVGRIEIMF